MMRGDLLVGSFANDQIGYHRPFKGTGTCRSEIPGLYLCGGFTHPGGMITKSLVDAGAEDAEVAEVAI